MFGRQTPKSQKAYSSVFVAHNPDQNKNVRIWPDVIRIISVDPGITHYAIRVEERNIKRPDVIKTLLFNKIGLKKQEQELSEDLVCPMYTFIQKYLNLHGKCQVFQ